MIDRRQLLIAPALAFGCGTPQRSREALPGAAAPTTAPVANSSADTDRAEHMRQLGGAIDSAGGLARLRGQHVIIKVNSNSGDPFPYSSSPATVAWLCTALADLGATVTVGDRSFWGDDDTHGNLVRNGIAAAAASGGARLVVLDDDMDWAEIAPHLVPDWTPPVRIPRLLLENPVINLACAKTHFISGFTAGYKNLLGIVHADDRRRPGNLRTHDATKLHRQIAQIHRAITPTLTIIDAFLALTAGGPTPSSGNAPRLDHAATVLASQTRLDVELATIRLLQRFAPEHEAIHATSPESHPTILAAQSYSVV